MGLSPQASGGGLGTHKGLLVAGVIAVLFAIVLFAIAIAISQSATPTLASCASNPSNVSPGACANAAEALATSVSLEAVSGVAALTALVLLVVGAILEPGNAVVSSGPDSAPRAAAPAQLVPPPGYRPPPEPMPPQRPPPPPKEA